MTLSLLYHAIMEQLSLRIIAMRKTLKAEAFLAEMNRIIPWDALLKELQPFYPERTEFKLEQLLRIHLLQQWYNLSDPAAEEALYDRLSFQRFVGLDGFTDKVPDESTILRFRHWLETHALTGRLFLQINAYLKTQGLVISTGTIMDATVFQAPISKKNASNERDPEMSSTRKNNNWHFGAKGHIGVQYEGLTLIHSEHFSTAKRNDGAEQGHLKHGNEQAIFGDAAYHRDEDKREARAKGIYYAVNMGRKRNQRKLSSGQKRKNRVHSSIRAKVEHPFRVMKVLWGHTKLRYKGLKKNASQFRLLCGLSNLFFARKALSTMRLAA
jgi:transposase, IS5 family